MKLFGVLCWWDESPSWLAATVASLHRAGVDHVIAVDGRYPHFDPSRDPASSIDQAETIIGTASALGMGVTLHRPNRADLTEAQKRELCHRLVEVTATPFEDWFIVIDADELVTEADARGFRELLSTTSAHCVALRVANTIDPCAPPGEADTDVNEKTAELYMKMPLDPTFASLQSRAWRVLTDMRVGPAHYHYFGTDESGKRVYLRPDIADQSVDAEITRTEIERFHDVTILHRRYYRNRIRRDAKKTYYELRDELGLERVTT